MNNTHKNFLKILVTVLIIFEHSCSLAMMSSLSAMPESYKKSLGKKNFRKISPLPDLPEKLQFCIAKRGSYQVKRNMRATCKAMKEKLDPYFEDMRNNISAAEDFLQKLNQFPGDMLERKMNELGYCSDECYGGHSSRSVLLKEIGYYGNGHGWALVHVLLRDDVAAFSRLAFLEKIVAAQSQCSGMYRDEFNNPFDQQRYITKCMYHEYKRLIANCVRYRAIECFKWAVQNPFFSGANNYWRKRQVLNDYGCYSTEDYHGPVLHDLQDLLKYAAKNTIAFFENNQLEAYCKKYGFKSRQEINNDGQAAIESVFTMADVMPFILKYYEPVRLSCGRFCANYNHTHQDLSHKDLRLINLFLSRFITIPKIENIKPFLRGEAVLKDQLEVNNPNYSKVLVNNTDCISAFKYAIFLGDTAALRGMMAKNMGALEDRDEQYRIYKELVIYALQKNDASFKLLIEQSPSLANYYNFYGTTSAGVRYPNPIGSLIDDIKKSSSISQDKAEWAIAFCRSKGCLTSEEIGIGNPQGFRAFVNAAASIGIKKMTER